MIFQLVLFLSIFLIEWEVKYISKSSFWLLLTFSVLVIQKYALEGVILTSVTTRQ